MDDKDYGVGFVPYREVICVTDIDLIYHLIDVIEQHAAKQEMMLDEDDYDNYDDYDYDLERIAAIRTQLNIILRDGNLPTQLLIRYGDGDDDKNNDPV